MGNGSERRQFWRAVFRSPVQLVDAAGVWPAELVDISLKGALVKMPPQWRGEISANCQIKLKLSEAVAIIMHAVVAHVEGRRAGLRCTVMDVDSVTHLRQLVALNAGDPALLERELSALLAEQ